MTVLLSDEEYLGKHSDFITRIREATTGEELNEASLGRILHHYEKSETGSFAVLIDNRSYVESGKTEVKRKSALFSLLKAMKLGHFKLIGHIVEDSREERRTEVRVPGYYIPGITLNQAGQLMKDLEVEFLVFSGIESDEKLWLLSEAGKVEERDAVTPAVISELFSQAVGKRVFFEGISWSVNEGILVQPVSGCGKIPGVKRWQEVNAEREVS